MSEKSVHLLPIVTFEEFCKENNVPQMINVSIPYPHFKSGNISGYETCVICSLAKYKNPLFVLEIGTFNGRTIYNLSANTPENTILFTVDLPIDIDIENLCFPIEAFRGKGDERGFIGKKNKVYENSEYEKKIVQIWKDSAKLNLSDLNNNLMDFIFIDGSHSEFYTYSDSVFSKTVLNKKGIIAWHDYSVIGGWEGVATAIHKLYDENFFQGKLYHIKDTSLVVYLSD